MPAAEILTAAIVALAAWFGTLCVWTASVFATQRNALALVEKTKALVWACEAAKAFAPRPEPDDPIVRMGW